MHVQSKAPTSSRIWRHRSFLRLTRQGFVLYCAVHARILQSSLNQMGAGCLLGRIQRNFRPESFVDRIRNIVSTLKICTLLQCMFAIFLVTYAPSGRTFPILTEGDPLHAEQRQPMAPHVAGTKALKLEIVP